MAYEVIPMPGGGTRFEENPEVRVVSIELSRPELIIKYACAQYVPGQPQAYGVIRFTGVLEYRWVDFDRIYFPYEDDEDVGFELILIKDSRWVEGMASKGDLREYPGQRFGLGFDEKKVKHYRLTFDDYGMFDVIAYHISIQEVLGDSLPVEFSTS